MEILHGPDLDIETLRRKLKKAQAPCDHWLSGVLERLHERVTTGKEVVEISAGMLPLIRQRMTVTRICRTLEKVGEQHLVEVIKGVFGGTGTLTPITVCKYKDGIGRKIAPSETPDESAKKCLKEKLGLSEDDVLINNIRPKPIYKVRKTWFDEKELVPHDYVGCMYEATGYLFEATLLDRSLLSGDAYFFERPNRKFSVYAWIGVEKTLAATA